MYKVDLAMHIFNIEIADHSSAPAAPAGHGRGDTARLGVCEHIFLSHMLACLISKGLEVTLVLKTLVK